jgi:hypothetical protein
LPVEYTMPSGGWFEIVDEVNASDDWATCSCGPSPVSTAHPAARIATVAIASFTP